MINQFIEEWVEDGVLHVLLNMPETFNQMEPGLAAELSQSARSVWDREEIRAVVLGGRGPHFSSGIDRHLEADDECFNALTLACQAIEDWARIPCPVVMALHGHTSSLGFSLACVADIRFAEKDVQFLVPEIQAGLVPAGGITQRLPRLIGKGPAMGILLGGETFYGPEAIELGFINKPFSKETLWHEACKEAKKLAANSSLAMRFAKECLLRGSELSLEQALRLELDMYMLLQTSEDRMEGVDAFLNKRHPVFKGR